MQSNDKYFEDKIKALEKRVRLLEDKALLWGGWPEFMENKPLLSLHNRAEELREYLKKEREIENDK
jgi:hypothetical protein